MALLPYYHFMHPLLGVLAAHPDGGPARAMADEVAARLNLTPEEKALLLPSGVQEVWRNRVG
jgi:restriction endonuclease Mrr